MRWTAVFLCACATPGAAVDEPNPLDAVWGQAIRPGDMIVAVPGTGGYTTLGAWIDAAVDAEHPIPTVDGRTNINPIVLEQALGAMRRAEFTNLEIATGKVTLALWGAGVTKATAFDYKSLDGQTVRFAVLGGTSVCADGTLVDNLTHYNRDDLDADARDLWMRTQASHPAGVTIVSHSWGGAVAEYVAMNRAALDGDIDLRFVVAAGVPAMVVGYQLLGPDLRDVTSGARSTPVYEVDRPDDMVHNLDPSGDLESHQYDIMFGDVFRGSYGITTDELSCHGIPGPCS
jgi:hypothetical protein